MRVTTIKKTVACMLVALLFCCLFSGCAPTVGNETAGSDIAGSEAFSALGTDMVSSLIDSRETDKQAGTDTLTCTVESANQYIRRTDVFTVVYEKNAETKQWQLASVTLEPQLAVVEVGTELDDSQALLLARTVCSALVPSFMEYNIEIQEILPSGDQRAYVMSLSGESALIALSGTIVVTFAFDGEYGQWRAVSAAPYSGADFAPYQFALDCEGEWSGEYEFRAGYQELGGQTTGGQSYSVSLDVSGYDSATRTFNAEVTYNTETSRGNTITGQGVVALDYNGELGGIMKEAKPCLLVTDSETGDVLALYISSYRPVYEGALVLDGELYRAELGKEETE